MAKPILYKSTETAFDSNGLGILSDAIKCRVVEELNGLFELELQYPIDGIHYADIQLRSLIMAKPNPVDAPQPFRVYRMERPINGIVTVYAQHISYDLSGIPVQPFTAGNAPAAMAALKSNAAVPCPFDFWTDKDTTAQMNVTVPASIRSLLGGVQGSVLDVYGGEYAFDRYTVRLYQRRGADRGVSIRYGKNLTSLQQDANCASVYTGVYPYWDTYDGAEIVQLPEKILPAPGTYDFTRILPLDLSAEWSEPPTVDQLRARAQRYMQDNAIGVPKVSLQVGFAQLEQSEEYSHLALLERVELGDTATVQFERLGVDATARVKKTEYDVLLERFAGVELGDARANIADTIAAQGTEIAQVPSKSYLQNAVDNATALITGNTGGYVLLHSSTGGKQPDEILIMNTPDIATATQVWRWNKAGLGYSSHGYNGPYALAMTQDGQIVADFITAGTINANLVRIINLIVDHLESYNDSNTMRLEAAHGTIKLYTRENTQQAWEEQFALLTGSQGSAKMQIKNKTGGTASYLTTSIDGSIIKVGIVQDGVLAGTSLGIMTIQEIDAQIISARGTGNDRKGFVLQKTQYGGELRYYDASGGSKAIIYTDSSGKIQTNFG